MYRYGGEVGKSEGHPRIEGEASSQLGRPGIQLAWLLELDGAASLLESIINFKCFFF